MEIQKQQEHRNLPSILPQKIDKIYSSNSNELALHVGSLTPQTAFGSQMSEFRKSYENQLFDSIEKLIAVTVMSLNLKHNLEVHQIAPVARAIYSKYYFYSLDELALVLRMGRQGEFGNLMHKLDEETIIGWFKNYDLNYREQFVINSRQKLNNEYESESTNAVINALGGIDLVKKYSQSIEDDLSEKEAKLAEFKRKYFSNEKPN